MPLQLESVKELEKPTPTSDSSHVQKLQYCPKSSYLGGVLDGLLFPLGFPSSPKIQTHTHTHTLVAVTTPLQQANNFLRAQYRKPKRCQPTSESLKIQANSNPSICFFALWNKLRNVSSSDKFPVRPRGRNGHAAQPLLHLAP